MLGRGSLPIPLKEDRKEAAEFNLKKSSELGNTKLCLFSKPAATLCGFGKQLNLPGG